jgi:hypothetical protein
VESELPISSTKNDGNPIFLKATRFSPWQSPFFWRLSVGLPFFVHELGNSRILTLFLWLKGAWFTVLKLFIDFLRPYAPEFQMTFFIDS